MDWRDDPFQQRFLLSSGMAVSQRPAKRWFHARSLAADAPLPGTMPNELMFMVLGWWVLAEREPPTAFGEAQAVLPAIARSSKYLVNPRQELVWGRWCHIVEYPGRDKLWVDCDQNCAILARELYEPKTWGLLQRVESTGHREIVPGVWAPAVVRNMHFDPWAPRPRGEKSGTTFESVLNTLDVRLNEQVSDELFRFEPLPGSIETDEHGVLKGEFPGCEDYLNEVVDWIGRHYRFPAISAGRAGSTTEAVVEYVVLGGGMVLLVGVLLRRSKRRGSRPRDVGHQNVSPVLGETRT
jgi:hypothetical protein